MKKIRQFCHVLLFSSCSFFASQTLASAPSPAAVITIGSAASALIASEACFSVEISNNGSDSGFGPYYRLTLPPQLTLASAKFLEQNLSTDVLGTFPASPGNQIIDSRANDASISGIEGYSLTNLVLPLSSLVQGGPTIAVDICVDVSTAAILATPLDISLQPVLQYGDSATGDNGAITGTTETSQITPTLMIYTSSNNAPSGKQVPGSTFGLTYTQVLDVAESQLVTSVILDEPFSSDLSFDQFTPAAPIGGTACAYGPTPGSNMTMSCTQVLGSATDNEVTSGYNANISDILNAGSCTSQTITHNSTLDGSYNGSPLVQSNDSTSVSARHLTLIKSLSGNTFNPSDTIIVSGVIRVSDFVTVNSLSVIDELPDGLTFATHGDLTINGGGSIAITPTSINNGDGSSTLTYDLTAVNGNIVAGSLIVYSYSVTVASTYNNTDPILASDNLSISGTATYDLNAGASNCTDSYTTSLNISKVSFSSQIINPQAEYNPGDVITYRLSMSVPSGDTQSINYSTYFPLPVFDVSTIDTTFGNDIIHSAGFDTMGSTPDSITVDVATNALIIDWPNISTNGPQILSVDVNITVTDAPFSDNLSLTTLFSGQVSNTPALVSAQINPLQTTVRNADLTIISGISAISHDGSLSDAGSNPANSDASNVDAGDTLTQTITIINDGGSAAYKISVSQPDLANLSGYSLTAATLNGGDISSDLSGSLSTTLVLDNSVSLPAGQSILLSYTYQLTQTVSIIELLQPAASVVWSASVTSSSAFPAQTDSIDINIDDMSISASVAAVIPAGNSGKFVTGDVVTYQANITLPEGTITDLVVDFALPAGLEYVAASSNILTPSFTGVLVSATEVTTGVVSTGQTRQFTFTGDITTTDNNNNLDNTFTITFNGLVKDDAANSAISSEQSKTLVASATYQGAINSQSDSDAQFFTEHQLDISTTVSPSSGLQAGDSATVTFVVTNNGTARLCCSTKPTLSFDTFRQLGSYWASRGV